MQVSRSNGDEKQKEEFEEWKKTIQDFLKRYKEDKEDEDMVSKVLKLIKEEKKN